MQGLRSRQQQVDLAKEACNSEMVCDTCGMKQRNRAFCYFCSSTQKTPVCTECGATKCAHHLMPIDSTTLHVPT
jgi:ribosomal protein L32